MDVSIPLRRPAHASLTRMLTVLMRALGRRRIVGRLSELDDRMLADIGITRQDVASALSEPLMVDPSARLATRALEARHGRRAAARLSMDWHLEADGRE